MRGVVGRGLAYLFAVGDRRGDAVGADLQKGRCVVQQLALFPPPPPKPGFVYDPDFVPDLTSYDRVLMMFSGGKDSSASFLRLISLGVPLAMIELWHQLIDGRGQRILMDWPVTPAYCQAFADAFAAPIYFQWKEGGFEREMLRDGSATAATSFELPDGSVATAGGQSGKVGTRLKFPQVSADLSVRWCSSYLKIDVAAIAIRNQSRFQHSRTLVITGERAEESPGRAKYAVFEPHRSDPRATGKAPAQNGRWVDHWRPILHWPEQMVWEMLEQYRVNPHPAYWLGFSRCSCMWCIFGNDDQWASGQRINPEGIQVIGGFEQRFSHTIARDVRNVLERAAAGQVYPGMVERYIPIAMSEEYTEPIIFPPGTEWQLPPGAFGDSCGPT